MTARVLFTLALLSSTALAQTYPSPTYQGLTLQADPTAASQAVRKGYLDQRLGTALPSLSNCMLLGGTGTAGSAQGVTPGTGLNCSANTLGVAMGTVAGTVAAGNDSRITGALQAAGGDASAATVTAAGGTTPRSFASLLADTVKVLNYGAKCDGTTDDTAAIRAAFAAAAAVQNGAVLEVPQRACVITGTISQSLSANRSIHLRGAGGLSGFLSPNGSGIAITLTDGTATFDASDLAFIRTGSGQAGIGLDVKATVVQAQSISHFKNLLFSGNAIGGGTAAWQEGLKLTSLSAPVVDGMRSFMPNGSGSGSGYGLHLTGSDLQHFLGDAKVVNSLFQGGQATIKIDGAVQGVYVTNSEGIGSDYGIHGADATGNYLQELLTVTNSHWNNALAGVYLLNFNENQISNNLFLHFAPQAGVAWQAIFADHSGYTTVTGNTVLGAGQGGETFFKATGSQLYAVTGNNAMTIAGQCIDTTGAWNVTVAGNSCQGVNEPGIVLGATSVASANTVNGRSEVVSPSSIPGTAPTAAVDTATTQLATTAFVLGQASGSAALPAGTAAAGTSTRFARADHVHPTDTSRAPAASPVFSGLLATSASLPNAAGSVQSDATAITANYTFIQNVGVGSGMRLPAISGLAAGSATDIEVFNYGSNDARLYPSSGESILPNAANAFSVVTSGAAVRCKYPGAGTTWICTAIPNPATLARLASPVLSGVPTAPTAATGTNSTQLATTAFVAAAMPAPAFQVVNTSGTFVPAGTATWVKFRLFGPGGAGGGGVTCASGASCSGGGGGGPGGMTDFWVPASRIQSGGCTVTVGTSGSSNTTVTCNTGLAKTAYRGGGGAPGSSSIGAGGGGGGGAMGAGVTATNASTGLSNPYPNTSASGSPLTVSTGGTSSAAGSCTRGADNNLGPTGGGGGTGLNAGAAVAVSNCGGGENPMSSAQSPIISDTGCEPNVGGASGTASTAAASSAGGSGGMPSGGGGGGGSGTVAGGSGGAGGAGRVCIWQG